MTELSPFRLMLLLFLGLTMSLFFGLISFGIIFILYGASVAQEFFLAYTISFKTIISLGLIIGTALIVFLTQNLIPETIESVFTEDQLLETDYLYYKKRFSSLRITLTFTSEFALGAFIIFSYSHFPMTGLAEIIMMLAVCMQYALGAYVGRKLIYIGMMLHSLLTIKVDRNLFQKRELDKINTYVHLASTLTIIFVYIHVVGYFGGPFLYDSILGQSIKSFLIIPAVVATPVLLIFNFYPRAVLKDLYSQSIDVEIKELQKKLQNEKLSEYEKRSYLIEFNKMSRDELRYSLQLTLSDLPIGITILIMVLEPILKR